MVDDYFVARANGASAFGKIFHLGRNTKVGFRITFAADFEKRTFVILLYYFCNTFVIPQKPTTHYDQATNLQNHRHPCDGERDVRSHRIRDDLLQCDSDDHHPLPPTYYVMIDFSF